MIGVFDSGFGGLTVLRAFLDHPELAKHSYLYLGDSSHAPYGEKTHEDIFARTVRGTAFLFERGCTLVIIACNSASAKALRRLQQEWLPHHYPNRRVLGVIRPIAEAIAHEPAYQTIGIIATPATVGSGAYNTEIRHLQPKATVIQKAAPALAPFIEAGSRDSEALSRIITQALQPLIEQSVDVVVPACTHYPLVRAELRQALPARIALLDTGAIIARALHRYLARHPELNVTPPPNTHIAYYTTGSHAVFAERGTQFLQKEVEHVTTVVI